MQSWWRWEHDKKNKKHNEKTEEEARKRNDIETIPPSLFAIVPPAPPWLNEDKAVSRGYLDDACDGFVRARLVVDGKPLTIDGKRSWPRRGLALRRRTTHPTRCLFVILSTILNRHMPHLLDRA